jgi:SAM-dependent methyltransferase
VLREVLPPSGLVLEVASGTGEHAAAFAPALPTLTWQPSDIVDAHLASIEAWRSVAGAPNLASPVRLDVEQDRWPVERADAVVAINLVHITPWSTTEALVRGAARVLPPAGVLFLYGPYKRDGQHTADSNARFDARLRGEDPRWGVRDLGEVERAADGAGFTLARVVTMPANNLSLVFRRR